MLPLKTQKAVLEEMYGQPLDVFGKIQHKMVGLNILTALMGSYVIAVAWRGAEFVVCWPDCSLWQQMQIVSTALFMTVFGIVLIAISVTMVFIRAPKVSVFKSVILLETYGVKALFPRERLLVELYDREVFPNRGKVKMKQRIVLKDKVTQQYACINGTYYTWKDWKLMVSFIRTLPGMTEKFGIPG